MCAGMRVRVRYVRICASARVSMCLTDCLSVCPSLSLSLSVYLCVCMCVYSTCVCVWAASYGTRGAQQAQAAVHHKAARWQRQAQPSGLALLAAIVRADAAAPAVLAVAPLWADAGAPAVLAGAPLVAMLADARALAVLALESNTVVLTDARAPAVLAGAPASFSQL